MTGVTVLREDWKLDQLPSHLKITYRVVDHRHRKLNESCDLHELKESLKRKCKRRFHLSWMMISNSAICIRGHLASCRKCTSKSVVALKLEPIRL